MEPNPLGHLHLIEYGLIYPFQVERVYSGPVSLRHRLFCCRKGVVASDLLNKR